MRLMGLIKGLLLISLVFLVFVTRSLLAPLQRYEKHNCSHLAFILSTKSAVQCYFFDNKYLGK